MKDFHSKPPPEERSVSAALLTAEFRRSDLPQIVQVHARDWDTVILADEIYRLKELLLKIEE